jgi:hypothetical protein
MCRWCGTPPVRTVSSDAPRYFRRLSAPSARRGGVLPCIGSVEGRKNFRLRCAPSVRECLRSRLGRPPDAVGRAPNRSKSTPSHLGCSPQSLRGAAQPFRTHPKPLAALPSRSGRISKRFGRHFAPSGGHPEPFKRRPMPSGAHPRWCQTRPKPFGTEVLCWKQGIYAKTCLRRPQFASSNPSCIKTTTGET